MKKLVGKFLLSMIGLSIFSCGNDERITYSCNPTENKWVHENLAEIRCMTRAQWNVLSENLKIPVYRAFPQQQKVNLWLGKLQEVLMLEGWSEDEREHINDVISFIVGHQDIFNDKGLTEEQENVVDLFCYRWTETAKERFGWDRSVIRSIIVSPNKVLDTKGTLAKSLVVSTRASKAEGSNTDVDNCNCNTSDNWCEHAFPDCEDVPCEGSYHGCGWFLVKQCDGICK